MPNGSSAGPTQLTTASKLWVSMSASPRRRSVTLTRSPTCSAPTIDPATIVSWPLVAQRVDPAVRRRRHPVSVDRPETGVAAQEAALIPRENPFQIAWVCGRIASTTSRASPPRDRAPPSPPGTRAPARAGSSPGAAAGTRARSAPRASGAARAAAGRERPTRRTPGRASIRRSATSTIVRPVPTSSTSLPGGVARARPPPTDRTGRAAFRAASSRRERHVRAAGVPVARITCRAASASPSESSTRIPPPCRVKPTASARIVDRTPGCSPEASAGAAVR